MTPKQQYYKNLADTMISRLEKRGFEASFVPDRQAALEAIMPYLTNGNTVSCGGSITLNEIGFNSAVKDANCTFLDRIQLYHRSFRWSVMRQLQRHRLQKSRIKYQVFLYRRLSLLQCLL